MVFDCELNMETALSSFRNNNNKIVNEQILTLSFNDLCLNIKWDKRVWEKKDRSDKGIVLAVLVIS